MAHWTKKNDKAFIHRITFDFIAQLERKIEALGLSQSDLAKKLEVTEGSVSQVLNSDRNNLTLKTMVAYATALGLKVAIVAYDDNDPKNEKGPVGSEIFTTTWEKVGRPRDVWSIKECLQACGTNGLAATDLQAVGHTFLGGTITNKFAGLFTSSGSFTSAVSYTSAGSFTSSQRMTDTLTASTDQRRVLVNA
jgi:transcriptional regulator with XRE-family HTH domain